MCPFDISRFITLIFKTCVSINLNFKRYTFWTPIGTHKYFVVAYLKISVLICLKRVIYWLIWKKSKHVTILKNVTISRFQLVPFAGARVHVKLHVVFTGSVANRSGPLYYMAGTGNRLQDWRTKNSWTSSTFQRGAR